MAYGLLEKWGIEGFMQHIERVAGFYREKRDMFVECLDRHLTGLAEWVVPDSGMFVWIKLLGGITDTYDLVLNKAVKHNVIAIPGNAFVAYGKSTPYVRVSYSCVTYEQMDEALRRLAVVIREEAAAKGSQANGHSATNGVH